MIDDRLLSLLIRARERGAEFVSGADMAEELGVSRTAVWKAVDRLREGGVPLEAEQSRGYRVRQGFDLIDQDGVRKAIDPQRLDPELVIVKSTTTSTNDDARRLAESGCPEFASVVASEQTAGRGRRGKAFYSPRYTGVYLSTVLRPSHRMDHASGITAKVAVAVCRALEQACGAKAQVKWVNDVFVGGHKVCGILTEASANLETSTFDYVIAGIGINVFQPDGGFGDGLASVAGSVLKEVVPGMRAKVAAEVLNRMAESMQEDDACVLDEYRSRSVLTGRRVRLSRGPYEGEIGTVEGIDDAYQLVVRANDGELRLNSSETSVTLMPDSIAC